MKVINETRRRALKVLLDGSPFNDDYTPDLLITSEKDRQGNTRRVFFALYEEQHDRFFAELRGTCSRSFDSRNTGNFALYIERYGASSRFEIKAPGIKEAFVNEAFQELASDPGNQLLKRSNDSGKEGPQ